MNPISFKSVFVGMWSHVLNTNEKKHHHCIPCGYTYDPVEGDPDYGIPPGTAFEDLPDSWVCPICGASKEMFEPDHESHNPAHGGAG